MLKNEAVRLLTPGKMAPAMAVSMSGFSMLSLFALDAGNPGGASLHSLYVYPLVLLVIHCNAPAAVLSGLGAALTLQAVTLTQRGVVPAAMLAEILIALASSGLMIALARVARDNFHATALLAAQDSLTELLNHRSLHAVVEAEIDRQRRYGGVFSLAMIDIDNFKQLNDTRGHVAGDEALVWMGVILRRNMRKTDSVGRIGGDEFAIVLPNTPSAECAALCQKLNSTIARDMQTARFALTTCIGHSTFEETPESIVAALKKADGALYAAKAAGKSLVMCA